jgi:hypothetical protein
LRCFEITLRLTLTASLIAAFVYGVSGWLTAPLGLIAIGATAELAIRPYATNAADRLLLACGAVVTVLILAGLALNLTPWGLTRITWAAAWLIVSFGVLVWRRRLSTRIGAPTWIKPLGIWMALAGLILAVAVALALSGVRHSNQQPTLAFSVISRNTGAVVVQIQTTSTSGHYRIMATSSAEQAAQYSSAVLNISAGSTGAQMRERVPLNVPGNWTISLVSANGSIVRSLKLNAS